MNTPSNESECSFRKKGSLKIGFRNPIPRGEYNLVVSTRCGDGPDYAIRRICHPVTVPYAPMLSSDDIPASIPVFPFAAMVVTTVVKPPLANLATFSLSTIPLSSDRIFHPG